MEYILHDIKLVKNYNINRAKCFNTLIENLLYIFNFIILGQFLLSLHVFFFFLMPCIY